MDDIKPSVIVERGPSHVPPHLRLYVVGDVNGRVDLLLDLLQRIAEDNRDFHGESRILFLGDYIDRGPASKEVLDILVKGAHRGLPFQCLRGNHEDILMRFFHDHSVAPGWFHYGGLQTLRSYGFHIENANQDFDDIFAYRKKLRQVMPETHQQFLANLPLHARYGDYFFTHAGIHPDEPAEGQDERNYMWMREPFLSSGKDLGVTVVHGHSIRLKPEVRMNRIGIDTGAYATGHLTCLVLEDNMRRFIRT